MAVCPNCGTQVPGTSKFCLECGCSMLASAPTPAPTPTPNPFAGPGARLMQQDQQAPAATTPADPAAAATQAPAAPGVVPSQRQGASSAPAPQPDRR